MKNSWIKPKRRVRPKTRIEHIIQLIIKYIHPLIDFEKFNSFHTEYLCDMLLKRVFWYLSVIITTKEINSGNVCKM